MTIAVTGSIAVDHLHRFRGRFTDSLGGDLTRVSLSFLAEQLTVLRGGTGANIAYGLGQLGCLPLLVGAIGADEAEYLDALGDAGVQTWAVHTDEHAHTARFTCTTDDDGNQLAVFHPGAMAAAAGLDLDELPCDAVVVAPNDPAAMARHTADAHARGLRVVADPGQQLAYLDGAAIRELVDGAELLFTNAYEADLLAAKTGWALGDVLTRVGAWIVTRGADGATVHTGWGRFDVPAVPAAATDPTGAGDAFRAGYLAAWEAGVGPEGCAQLGAALGAVAVEHVGPQGWELHPGEVVARVRAAYGDGAASRVLSVLDGVLTLA